MDSFEVWKHIPGNFDVEISTLGNLRTRLDHKGSPLPDGQWVHVEPGKHVEGYYYTKYGLVHRLVLLTFVGPCPTGKLACHRNDIKTDNRLVNLYWGTPVQNSKDANHNGIRRITLNRATVAEIKRRIQCEPWSPELRDRLRDEFGVRRRTLYRIARGTYWASVSSCG